LDFAKKCVRACLTSVCLGLFLCEFAALAGRSKEWSELSDAERRSAEWLGFNAQRWKVWHDVELRGDRGVRSVGCLIQVRMMIKKRFSIRSIHCTLQTRRTFGPVLTSSRRS
jgi:hypothetical protein